MANFLDKILWRRANESWKWADSNEDSANKIVDWVKASIMANLSP